LAIADIVLLLGLIAGTAIQFFRLKPLAGLLLSRTWSGSLLRQY